MNEQQDPMERAIELLGKHQLRGGPRDRDGDMKLHCLCGWQVNKGEGARKSHRAHQVRMLNDAGLLVTPKRRKWRKP